LSECARDDDDDDHDDDDDARLTDATTHTR
jgi:hypothetical protein